MRGWILLQLQKEKVSWADNQEGEMLSLSSQCSQVRSRLKLYMTEQKMSQRRTGAAWHSSILLLFPLFSPSATDPVTSHLSSHLHYCPPLPLRNTFHSNYRVNAQTGRPGWSCSLTVSVQSDSPLLDKLASWLWGMKAGWLVGWLWGSDQNNFSLWFSFLSRWTQPYCVSAG